MWSLGSLGQQSCLLKGRVRTARPAAANLECQLPDSVLIEPVTRDASSDLSLTNAAAAFVSLLVTAPLPKSLRSGGSGDAYTIAP